MPHEMGSSPQLNGKEMKLGFSLFVMVAQASTGNSVAALFSLARSFNFRGVMRKSVGDWRMMLVLEKVTMFGLKQCT